jgi:hypothetical protein
MKAFRSTGLLAVVVAAIVGITVFINQRDEKSAAQVAEQEKVVKVTENDVSQIKIVKPTETLLLKRDAKGWSVAEPLVDEVENETMSSFMGSISQERATDLTKEKKPPINWTEYHLEPPGATFEFTKKDNQVETISVSKSAAFDGNYFLRRGDQLLLGSNAWGGIVGRDVNQFRSKKVLRQSGVVQRINVEGSHSDAKDKFTLTKVGDKEWVLDGAPGLAIDADKVTKFVEHIKNLRALDFLSDKPKLDAPISRISFVFEKQDPEVPVWQIEVGPEKDGVAHGKSTSVSAIFKLSSHDAEQLRVDRGRFRNEKQPFQLDGQAVTELLVKTDGKKWTYKKQGNDWEVVEKTDKPVDSKNVQSVVGRMLNLEAKEFLGSKPAKGDGRHQLEFRDKEGKTMLKVSFGDEFTPSSGPNKGTPMIYARSSLVPDTVAVRAGDLKEMPLGGLFKNPEEQAKPTELPQQSGQK